MKINEYWSWYFYLGLSACTSGWLFSVPRWLGNVHQQCHTNQSSIDECFWCLQYDYRYIEGKAFNCLDDIILTLDLHKNNIVYSDVRVVYITNKAIRLWRLIRFNDILIGITIIITVLVIKFENSWLSTADLAVLNKIPTSWDYLVAITWPLKGSSSNQYLSTLLMLCTA